MTLAQHDPGPARQQRWIELYNVGSSEVPAYGACEVVNSSRPENGGYTPGGGPTVLHVRRAEESNPCNHVINGHCPIPVGHRKKVGTKDSPMLALVASDYPAGTGIGIKKDSYILEEDYCGYVVDGDYDASSGTQRVTRYDNCPNEMMVRSLSCVLIGEEQYAQPQKWDDDSSDYVDDTDRDPVTVIDPLCWRVALIDDQYKVERENCSSNKWRPSMPYGLTRRVKIKAEIDCGTYGPATLLKNDSSSTVGCTWAEAEPACLVNVCNTANRKIACDADEEATAVWLPGECIAFLIANARAMTATAALTGAMCGDAAGISGAGYEDVCEWEPRVPPTSAENPGGLYGCSGDTVLLRWNDEDCGWDVVAVSDHKIGKPMLDLECNESTKCQVDMSRLKADLYGHQCASCGEAETTATGLTSTEIEYVDGFTNTCDATSGCGSLVFTRKKICVICGTEEAGTGGTIITYAEKDVFTDMRQNGLNVEAYATTLCVICAYDVGWETVLEGTDCSSSSS